MSSNMRRAPIYFRLRHPTREVSFGGTTCLLCLTLYAIMFIELCSNFMSLFTYSMNIYFTRKGVEVGEA
jgi:hypothetical protein